MLASYYVGTGRPDDGPLVHIVATYQIDALETVKVPAGEFECLRIWRRAKPTSGNFYRETTLYWYAPKVGFWVRKLEGRLETELVDYERQ